MNQQVTPIQQVGSQLKVDNVYYVNTSHERMRDYIYEGVINGVHQFFRDGAIIDHMRRITVRPEDLNVEGKVVRIINDSYKVNGVSKDEHPAEYLLLERLWRFKDAK